jgi:hypothetical protein
LVSPGTAVAATNASPVSASVQQLHGFVVAVQGDMLVLRLRSGQTEDVDIAAALTAHHTGLLAVGSAVVVYGSRDSAGLFHAESVGHASPTPRNWTADS